MLRFRVAINTAISRCVLASGNPGKILEVERILGELGIHIVPQGEFNVSEADESGQTFVENALIKAHHAANATGLPALADDSGLAVDALNGRPGVYSARYAGVAASDDENVDKLLLELQDVPEEDRAAGFHCAVVLVSPDDSFEPQIAEAVWRGSILSERRGDRGFGYDPVFLDPQSGLASAELDAPQKNQRSHRGQALRKLANMLRD
jgi:XTP/dITP diphosphohydrolase